MLADYIEPVMKKLGEVCIILLLGLIYLLNVTLVIDSAWLLSIIACSHFDTDCYGPQFSAERGILSRAPEFAHFRRIFTFSRNFAEFCTDRDKGTNI